MTPEQIEQLVKRANEAEAKCAEMREFCSGVIGNYMALAHCEPIENLLEFIQQKGVGVLSSCGKGWINARELDRTLYVLKSVLIYDKLTGIDSVKEEIERLEKLREGTSL